ncbi:MAG TPA: rhodanese-like domain-containing protein [Thermoleophilaceae bacterium]|nr:rhodanese-like domain-containing protein [Thermoleophilaceae bacterium]
MADLADLQEELTPEQASELAARGEVRLVDVREAREWDEGHIEGARHVEMDQLVAEAESLSGDPPVVFYCRTGGRSSVASQAFRASGVETFNLAGGLVAWTERGLPLEPEDGSVAIH